MSSESSFLCLLCPLVTFDRWSPHHRWSGGPRTTAAMRQLLPAHLRNNNFATFKTMLKDAIDTAPGIPWCPLELFRSHLTNGGAMNIGTPVRTELCYRHPAAAFFAGDSPHEVAQRVRAIITNMSTLMEHGPYIVRCIIEQLQHVSAHHPPHEHFNNLMVCLLDRADSHTARASASLVKMLFQEVERQAVAEECSNSLSYYMAPGTPGMSALLHVQTYTTAIRACMAQNPTCQSLKDVLGLLGNMFALYTLWGRADLQPNAWTWTTAINAALKVCVVCR